MSDKADVMLIAYDGSEEADRAIRYAGRFLSVTRAIIVTAWEPLHRQAARAAGMTGLIQPDWSREDAPDPVRADAEAIAARGAAVASEAGFEAEAHLIESTSAIWTAIIAAADRFDVDIIVSGTRGTTGLKSLLQSSVADHVLRHGHRPVFIVPPTP